MWIGNVIIYRDLAYVPVMHTLGTGGWYTGEPVTVVPVTVDDLARDCQGDARRQPTRFGAQRCARR